MNLFLNIYRYICGNLKIEVTGEFCERMLNVMSASGIPFWNIEKHYESFVFYILKKDFLKLKELRKKVKVSVKIKEKNGFFKMWKNYRKRYGIAVGIILFISFLNIMSSRIWIINVNGTQQLSDDNIVKIMNTLGVKNGIPISEIDTDILKQKLILSSENISWASLNIQGCVLEVNISEYQNSSKEDVNACNIIAEYDAVITEVNVKKGVSLVKVGDTVIKGQILVSGIITENGGNSFICSEAEIFGSVPEKAEINIPKEYTEKIYSGKVGKKSVIEIFNIKIPLFIESKYKTYDSEVKQKQVIAFAGKIPIKFYTEKRFYYTEGTFTANEEVAVQKALKIIDENMKNSKVKSYTLKNEKIVENTYGYTYNANIRKVTDIAKKDFFKINNEN